MSTDLRMLSVRQPHAWAICSGHKDVENRTWRFPYEMPCTIGIQAGVHIDPDGLDGPAEPPDDLPRGGVLGLVDVFSDHDNSECVQPDGTLCSPWAVPGHRHWVLATHGCSITRSHVGGCCACSDHPKMLPTRWVSPHMR